MTSKRVVIFSCILLGVFCQVQNAHSADGGWHGNTRKVILPPRDSSSINHDPSIRPRVFINSPVPRRSPETAYASNKHGEIQQPKSESATETSTQRNPQENDTRTLQGQGRFGQRPPPGSSSFSPSSSSSSRGQFGRVEFNDRRRNWERKFEALKNSIPTIG